MSSLFDELLCVNQPAVESQLSSPVVKGSRVKLCLWVSTKEFIDEPVIIYEGSIMADRTAASLEKMIVNFAIDASSSHVYYEVPRPNFKSVVEMPFVNPLLEVLERSPYTLDHQSGETFIQQSMYYSLQSIDMSSLLDEDPQKRLQSIRTMSQLTQEMPDVFYLTHKGNVYTSTGPPNSISSLMPMEWPTNKKILISRIDCGSTHALFGTHYGEVFGTGSNLHGQLSEDLNLTFASSPISVKASVIDFKCGSTHSLLQTNSNSISILGSTFDQKSTTFDQNEIQLIGAGNDFNAVVIKTPNNEQHVLTWGNNNENNKLCRTSMDYQLPLPIMETDVLKSQLIHSLFVHEEGGCLILHSQIAVRTSLYLWGEIPGDNIHYLREWKQQMKNSMDVIHVYFNSTGLGVLTVEWKQKPAIPILKLAPMEKHPSTMNEFLMKWKEPEDINIEGENSINNNKIIRNEKHHPMLEPSRGTVLGIGSRSFSSEALLSSSSSSMIRKAMTSRHAFLHPLTRNAIPIDDTSNNNFYGLSMNLIQKGQKLYHHYSSHGDEVQIDKNDKYSILLTLMKPEWDKEPLRTLRFIGAQFEKFRRCSTQFWERYLQNEGLSSDKHLKNLRSEYLNLLKYIQEKLGPKEALSEFDLRTRRLHHQTNSSHIDQTNWSFLKKALLNEWNQVGTIYTPITRKIPSFLYNKDKQLSHEDEERLRKLRLKIFGDSAEQKVDIPKQHWEITSRDLLDIQPLCFNSLLPDPNRSYNFMKANYCGGDVLLKVTTIESISDEIIEDCLHEIYLYQYLRHANISVFMGAIIREAYLIVMTEFNTKGFLWNFLYDSVGDNLQLKDLIAIAIDIANGLIYLHSAAGPYIHRNLNSANIILTGGNVQGIGMRAKICNFEFTQKMPHPIQRNSQHHSCTADYLTSFSKGLNTIQTRSPQSPSQTIPLLQSPFIYKGVGSIPWSPPEDYEETTSTLSAHHWNDSTASDVFSRSSSSSSLMLNDQKTPPGKRSQKNLTYYSEKFDIYSFGVLLWEMFHRTPPFLGVNLGKVAELAFAKDLRVPLDSLSAILSTLITCCLHTDPCKRPDATTVLEVLKSWDRQLDETPPGVIIIGAAAKDALVDVVETIKTETQLYFSGI